MCRRRLPGPCKVPRFTGNSVHVFEPAWVGDVGIGNRLEAFCQWDRLEPHVVCVPLVGSATHVTLAFVPKRGDTRLIEAHAERKRWRRRGFCARSGEYCVWRSFWDI